MTDDFEKIMQLKGEVFRHKEGRTTLRTKINNKFYFLKKHTGIGWKEIFKNIFQGRLPIVSAKNEYLAIKRLEQLKIAVPKVVSYARLGFNPAKLQSYILTEELPEHISLEDFCKNWNIKKPDFSLKLKLIKEVARIARTLHQHGINHRDFYICHLLLEVAAFQNKHLKLYLIDLHRAEVRKKIPERWQVKDLAQLYFSSKNIGLTARDFLRFMREYSLATVADIVRNNHSFWNKVELRGEQLYRKHRITSY